MWAPPQAGAWTAGQTARSVGCDPRRPPYRPDMAKLIYYTACTLDGFIADEDDSLSWLFEVEHGDDDGAWDAFYGNVGALCMGSTTYEWILDHERLRDHPEKGRDFYPGLPCWVFTHRELWQLPGADVRFASGDVRPVHDEMVAAAGGKDLWVVGGGDLVGQFDDAGLLDEVRLGMCPVTLGAGRPLLPRRITSERLRFREVAQVGQRVELTLDVAQR